MSGPWEQFQSTEQEPGPWNDFASSDAPKKAVNYGDIDKNVGVAQGAAQVVTGAAAAVPAGLGGLGTAIAKALGITDTDPADVVRKIQEALTYQAPSQTGQDVAGAISYLPEKLAAVADTAGAKVTDVTGSPALGAAANTGIQAVPALLGKVAGKVAPKLSAMEDAASAKRAVVATDELPAREGITAAREAGYVVTPNEAKAGVVARSTEGLAGSAKLQKAGSNKNQPNTNRLIREDIGLDENTPAKPEAIQAIIDEAHKPYEAVKKVGAFENDPQYIADIDQITKSQDTAASVYEHRQKLTPDEQRLQDTVEGLKKADTSTTTAAVEEVKLLRANAKKAFRDGDTKLGSQYRALAEAVDGSMDRALQKMAETGDDPALKTAVAEYQAARVKIAKAYQAQDALGVDGNFDANVYGKIFKDKPELLTGPALQVGKFAAQFPKLVQQAQKVGHVGMDYGDLALMAFRAAKGAAGDALLLGARPATRSALLSDTVQKSITKPPSYGRPLSSRAAQLAADAQSLPAVQGAEMGAGQSRQDRLNYLKELAGGP